MKKFDIHRYWIPGKSMARAFVPLGIWTFIYLTRSSSIYSLRFSIALRSLGWAPGTSTYSPDAIIDPSIKMTPFGELMWGSFAGYWLLVLFCLLYILDNWLLLRKDRSMYIMKRVPAVETFKRCAVVLLIYALSVMVLTLIIILLLRLQYVNKVPPQCIPQEGSLKLFGAFDPRGFVSLVRLMRIAY